MSDPFFDAWAGPDPGPWVKVFESWDPAVLPSSGGPAGPAASVPVSFTKVPVSIDPADLALLRSGTDLLVEARRSWFRSCEAALRAALVGLELVPVDADWSALVRDPAFVGRLRAVVQPGGALGCYFGSVFLCHLPPDPVAALRASVDARLRDGLF